MANTSPIPFVLKSTMLQMVCTRLGKERAEAITGLINDICPRFGINTADRMHEFIAQVAHESAEFTCKAENLNYSDQGLANTWPQRFAIDPAAKVKTPNTLARQLHRKPVAIANTVYAGRMGNGGAASNDGWEMRGGGFIQLTGKDIYTRYGRVLGISAKEAAEMVRSSDRYALHSSCWVFSVEKQLLAAADKDDFLLITKRINGGTTGWADRNHYYDLAKKYIV